MKLSRDAAAILALLEKEGPGCVYRTEDKLEIDFYELFNKMLESYPAIGIEEVPLSPHGDSGQGETQ